METTTAIMLNDIRDANYVALETFRQNGEGVITPVWVAGENGNLYVWTDQESWKVKRIRKDHRVRLCESDSRGNPKSEWVEAQASILDSEEALQRTRSLFKSKYGIQFSAFGLMGRKKPKAIVEISAQ